MVKLTRSLYQWLWDNHRDIVALIMLGHTELLTDEMWAAYHTIREDPGEGPQGHGGRRCT